MVSQLSGWSGFFLRWRYVLAAIIATGYCLGLPLKSLEFDRSLERMFTESDPVLAPFRHFQRTFGGNSVVLAVYEDEQLLQSDGVGLRRLASVSAPLRDVAGVRDVFSLDRILGNNPDLRDATVERLIRLFTGVTHGADAQTAAVVCLLDSQHPEEHAEAVGRIRQIMAEPFPGGRSGFVTGEPVLVHQGFTLVEDDGRRLSRWTLILLSLTILVCFRRFRWMLATLLVVHVSIRMTESLVSASGLRLTLVSSMLAAMISVVAIATMVHLITWFMEYDRTGESAWDALGRTLDRLSAPVAWSCITDAVGFGSLMLAHVSPVHDFGLMTAIGSVMVLVSVFGLFPTLTLCWSSKPSGLAIAPMRESRFLRATIDWVYHHPRSILAMTLAASSLIGCGCLWVEVETDFTRNFRQDSEIVQSYARVERQLGGAGVMEIALPCAAQPSWEFLDRVLRLESRLRRELGDAASVSDEKGDTRAAAKGRESAQGGGLTKVLSLADAVTAGSPIDFAKLPRGNVRNVAVQAGIQAMRLKMPAFLDTLFAKDPEVPDLHWFRIMLRARERQSVQQKLANIAAIERIVREETSQSDWKADWPEDSPANSSQARPYVTGYFVLLANLIQSVSRDQWLTFGVATFGVGLCLLAAFRRPTVALLALIPNIIPGFLVLGLMGWTGLRINMGAAMIAAVSMGLTVDSSVHYLSAFFRERQQGATLLESLHRVQQGVGRAAILSTVALMVGFSVLCTSDFVPTIYFGFLVNLAMLSGVIGNLVMLPLLLRLTHAGEVTSDSMRPSGEKEKGSGKR